MIRIKDTLISEDVIEKAFVCDLSKCKGICCVEGDSGAPVEKQEQYVIEENLEVIKPHMAVTGREYALKNGFFETDREGDRVTQCVDEKACVFAVNQDGVWACAIEKAWEAGDFPFRKPVSCHLYPVRIQTLDFFTAVNYDRWDICSPACTLGKSLKVPVYKFVKDALIRRFGPEWYKELELVAEAERPN